MILSFIFSIFFISLLLLFFIPKNSITTIRQLTLTSNGLVFLLACILLISFKKNLYSFQDIFVYNLGFDYLNLYIILGLDGISLLFFVLSSFLIFLCTIFIWNEKFLKEYSLTLIILNLLLLLVFSVMDLLLFYVFFEAILIPMYLLVGVWGSRERKVRAAYLLFFYT